MNTTGVLVVSISVIYDAWVNDALGMRYAKYLIYVGRWGFNGRPVSAT